MSFTKLWQRYFLVEILKTFSLFLFCFFSLYVLIDYSTHLQEILKNKKISMGDLSIYYGMLFSKRCNILLPLALLISSVKVLTSFNRQNELLALQTSGVPIHQLTRPFFFVGLLCVALSYCNSEILAPKSLNYIDHFEQEYLKKKPKNTIKEPAISALPLEDGTRLLYQKYDPHKKEFFDSFWIRSINEIYHMKTLTITDTYPVGTFVDLMERDPEGQIKKTASYKEHQFKELILSFHLQDHLDQPVENRSISNLFTITLNKVPSFFENRRNVHTHLYFKLFMPWLPVLVLIGVIPFCMPSVRYLPTFLIFALTIFGYIAFFAVMDGCVILGESQVLPPFWAIFSLPIAFFAIFGTRFFKLCIK